MVRPGPRPDNDSPALPIRPTAAFCAGKPVLRRPGRALGQHLPGIRAGTKGICKSSSMGVATSNGRNHRAIQRFVTRYTISRPVRPSLARGLQLLDSSRADDRMGRPKRGERLFGRACGQGSRNRSPGIARGGERPRSTRVICFFHFAAIGRRASALRRVAYAPASVAALTCCRRASVSRPARRTFSGRRCSPRGRRRRRGRRP